MFICAKITIDLKVHEQSIQSEKYNRISKVHTEYTRRMIVGNHFEGRIFLIRKNIL